MRQALRMRTAGLLACALPLTVLSSCSSSAEQPASRPRSNEVVVSSYNFPESALLAEIYAQAIEAAGIPVAP